MTKKTIIATVLAAGAAGTAATLPAGATSTSPGTNQTATALVKLAPNPLTVSTGRHCFDPPGPVGETCSPTESQVVSNTVGLAIDYVLATSADLPDVVSAAGVNALQCSDGTTRDGVKLAVEDVTLRRGSTLKVLLNGSVIHEFKPSDAETHDTSFAYRYEVLPCPSA